MRTFPTRRRVRWFVVPAVVLPLMAAAFGLPGAAWARGGGKGVLCQGFTGTDGGMWQFIGCTQLSMTGGQGTIPSLSMTAPPTQATITWGAPANRRAPSLRTTISIAVKQRTGHRDKCGGSASEYQVTGTVLSNSALTGVKGKVNWFVCDAAGTISDLGTKRFPKKAKF